MKLTGMVAMALPFAGVAGIAGTAVADSNFYVGAAYAGNSLDDIVSNNSGSLRVTEDPDGYKLIAGLQFGDYMAIEGGYADFGSADTEIAISDFVAAGRTDLDGFTIAVEGRLPLLGGLDLTGHLGLISWDATAQAGPAIQVSDDGSDLFYGVGADFTFLQRFAVFARFERFDIDAVTVDSVNAGVKIRF